VQKFWNWYERNLKLNTGIAAFLFSLQLIHLFWLFTNVVLLKLTDQVYFEFKGIWEVLIVLVDYTEIPAILTTSLLYINDYRKGKKSKAILYLLLLNSQWLHIFWITDEYVIGQFTGQEAIGIPMGLAWVAISIDYLELPIIYDTLKRVIKEKSLEPLAEQD
jgi:hypothetical protein